MAGRYSLREIIRYRIDNLITKSPVSQILALAVLSVLIVFLGTLAVSSAAPDALLLEGEGHSAIYRMWWSFTRLVDPGTFVNDSTTALVALTGIVVTLGGILVFSMLIGILSSKIGEKLDELKRGKSTVIEEGHTIIVGNRDKEVVKTLLAVWSLTAEKPLRAVCEIADRRMFEIAEMAYRGVRWVPVTQIVMRLMVQVCRQPGLSAVYSEILSFSGNEFYFIDAPGTEGSCPLPRLWETALCATRR